MSIISGLGNVLLAGSLARTAHDGIKGGNYLRKAGLDKWRPKPHKVKTGLFRSEYRTRLGKRCDKKGRIKTSKRNKGGKKSWFR